MYLYIFCKEILYKIHHIFIQLDKVVHITCSENVGKNARLPHPQIAAEYMVNKWELNFYSRLFISLSQSLSPALPPTPQFMLFSSSLVSFFQPSLLYEFSKSYFYYLEFMFHA